MESKNKQYLTYCRKSREDKEAQVLSIQSQIEELSQYATNNDLPVVAVRDESHTAAKTGRPVFNDVMNMIEAGKANALLVWKFDRISRNEIDTARVIKAFRDGILEEIRTPFETYRKGDNVLLLYIYFGMADEYSRQLSANVKRGNRTKLKLGQYPGHAPFGYRNYNRDNVKNIEPDEDAPIVKQIFNWYASGEYSLGKIRNKLNLELKIQSKYGHKFSKGELQKILRNKIYYGIIERGGELFAGTFEAIITKDLYDKVQQIRDNKSRPRGKKEIIHAYKLLIRCEECSSVYTGYTKHKFYPKTDRHAYYTYYACAKKRGVCSQKQINEKDIESQMITELSCVEFDKTEWDIATDLMFLDLEKNRQFEFDQISRYNIQITKIKTRLDTLLELRTDKEITSEEYLAKKNKCLDDIKAYEGKIKEVKKFANEKFELVENFAEVILRAEEILNGDDVVKKRQLARSVSSNLSLLNGKLKISFRKPFSFFFKRLEQQKPYTVSGREDLNLRPHGPKPRALAN